MSTRKIETTSPNLDLQSAMRLRAPINSGLLSRETLTKRVRDLERENAQLRIEANLAAESEQRARHSAEAAWVFARQMMHRPAPALDAPRPHEE